MKIRCTLLLVVFALLAGCGVAKQVVNDPLDAAVINQLKPGKTTARQVVEMLGGPNEVVQLGLRTAYRYDSTSTKSAVLFLFLVNLANQDTRQDRLWVFFDTNDILTHFGASYGTHRTQYAMPWQDVHDGEGDDSRDEQRAGVGK
jgi:outer membrane protein assembly factor BamE (lipoprotein component of BamABCDE complex)